MFKTVKSPALGMYPYIPDSIIPWNAKTIQHLFRRISFGIPHTNVSNFINEDPQEVIDTILSDAQNAPITDPPVWAFWTQEDFNNSDILPYEARRDWQKQAVNDFINNGLRDKMTLFWSNHFVTEMQVYNAPSYLYQYYHVLQTNALGNFKEFVRAIGLTPAMLIYLNGFENRKNNPNENYARELYELFTLGENNGYTQDDIVETAKALTGWNTREENGGPITFNPDTFDDSDKIIFGNIGNWGYDDVVDNLFAEKAPLIAEFICSKIYTFFIGPEIDATYVNGMAETFIDNNFEIFPVINQLVKSEHFFEQVHLGVVIKSPLNLLISSYQELNFEVAPDFDIINRIVANARDTGQNLFNPPDVAGWQGDKAWMNATAFTNRWLFTEQMIRRFWNHDREQFRQLAVSLVDGSNDPAYITQTILDYILVYELPNPEEYEAAIDVFKLDIPQNYYDEGLWDLSWEQVPKQVFELLKFVIRIPEFQLK